MTNTFAPLSARRRSLLWRVHFWSALIASPFVLVACLTGLLYVFTPQIERYLHGHLDTVVPQEQVRPLDDAVAAAINVSIPFHVDFCVLIIFCKMPGGG